FEPASEPAVEHLIDAMQRDSGVPYLILNLLRRGEIAHARALAQTLLHEETQVDDELKSSLYWIAEVHGFTRERASLGDIESSLRYLYHVCFTDPERAGFLEIDSRYFSQFTMV